MQTTKTDQTSRMRELIWVRSAHTSEGSSSHVRLRLYLIYIFGQTRLYKLDPDQTPQNAASDQSTLFTTHAAVINPVNRQFKF